MGAFAAGNAYQEMLNLGYEKGQARAYSTLVGASEAGLQYLQGGIGKLGGKLSGAAVEKIISSVDNAFARAAIKLGGNMLSEGTEEGLQEILTPWFKQMATHIDEDVNWDQVAYSSLMGTLTGFFMEGGDAALGKLNQQAQYYNTGKEIKDIDGGVDALLNAADQLRSVSSTQMQNTLTSQIDKVRQKPTARNVGQLNATVQAANNQANAAVNKANSVANQADVAKSLRNKGISSKKVDGIAEAIVASLNGQELTRPKRNLLSSALNTSAVRDTISEFRNRRKTTTEQPSPEQRHQEFSETAVLPEQYEQLERGDFTWKHSKAVEQTLKVTPEKQEVTQKQKKSLDKHKIHLPNPSTVVQSN